MGFSVRAAASGTLLPVTVVAIHLGEERNPELWPVDSVSAMAGKGLEGDRYFFADGAEPGRALTLVEEEAVEKVGLAPGATRRQLTTRGMNLNELIGKRFRVGDVECYGVELCEPCLHLEKMTRPRNHQGARPPRRDKRRHPHRRDDLRRRRHHRAVVNFTTFSPYLAWLRGPIAAWSKERLGGEPPTERVRQALPQPRRRRSGPSL